MERRTKWLVGVTIANLACSALLALVVYAILEAFAAFAAYVSTWPLFVMFPICIALSVLGLRLARKTRSKKGRWFGYVLNGLPLVVPSLILFFLGDIFFHMDRTRYIIPDGYQGYVYILHGIASGVPERKGHWEVTYRIPGDGVLLVQAPVTGGFKAAKYYYALKDGSLRRIPSSDSAAHTDPREVVAFPAQPENNGYGESSETWTCNVEYEWFYLGTGPIHVAEPKWEAVAAYLHAHPSLCASGSK